MEIFEGQKGIPGGRVSPKAFSGQFSYDDNMAKFPSKKIKQLLHIIPRINLDTNCMKWLNYKLLSKLYLKKSESWKSQEVQNSGIQFVLHCHQCVKVLHVCCTGWNNTFCFYGLDTLISFLFFVLSWRCLAFCLISYLRPYWATDFKNNFVPIMHAFNN